MSQPAAKKGDQVTASDIHLIQSGIVVTPIPHPFTGKIDGKLSRDVEIMGKKAATVDSTAPNTPSHIPQGGTFVKPPSNKATIKMGSTTVFINGKAAARSGEVPLPAMILPIFPWRRC